MVVVLGRLDHMPSKLQSLGFDICDGKPCFRGIKIGEDWTTAEKIFPQSAIYDDYIQIEDVVTNQIIWVHKLKYNDTVDDIRILLVGNTSLPLSADDFIAQYGTPCRVLLYPTEGDSFDEVEIFYPTMSVNFGVFIYSTQTSRFDRDSPIRVIHIGADTQNGCDKKSNENFGPWHGFKSPKEYRRYNLHELSVAQNTSSNP